MTRRDVQTVSEIGSASFPSPWRLSSYARAISGAGHEFYVAELRDGRMGAFLAFNLATRELDSLYVAPWGQGLGLGSHLLGLAEETFRLVGLRHIWLDASLNAVSFYAKHGWMEKERHARVRQGVDMPVVKMEKTLRP